MKILSIGTDRKLFHEDSSVFLRAKEYASRVKEMHVIVFSLKKHAFRNYNKDNLYIYPTNSSSRLMYIFDAIKIGKKIITTEGFGPNNTVLTSQDPFETGLVGYFLHSKFHLPFQVQVHTDYLSSYFNKNFLNFFRVIIARIVVPKADSLRVVSSVIADSIIKKFPKLKTKVHILPIFVDTKKIIDREVEFDGVNNVVSILMVSRFAKEKRIEVGLQAFKMSLDTNLKARLTLVGSGPERENLLRIIDELDLADSVDLLGWENDVVLRYKTSDIYLLTSEYEGYGMTLVEAGASGCAIITTNVGIAKTDLFKDGYNSYVCNVGDVSGISNRLNDLIMNAEKRKLFKQRMQDSIKSASISKEEYVSRYIQLQEKLLNHA